MKPGRGDPQGLVQLPAGPGTVGKDGDCSSDITSSTTSSSSLSSERLARIVEQLKKVKMGCDQPDRAVVPRPKTNHQHHVQTKFILKRSRMS